MEPLMLLMLVIGYVALTSAVNGILGVFVHGLTIQTIFAYLFSPFAFLLGLPVHDAMYVHTSHRALAIQAGMRTD